MSNVEVKKILTDARALVEHGWIKGEYERRVNGVMCYCASGARIQASVGRSESDIRGASAALSRSVPAKYSGNGDVVHFNDAAGTTKEDVLALFDRAIESVS